MPRNPKSALADIPDGLGNPFEAAVAAREMDTVAMVRDAIQKRRVRLAYQAVVNAHATKVPIFYEGLIRVLDPSGRAIPARDFIRSVEDTDVGRQLDCVALDLGLAALARKSDLRLSINMSARAIGYKRWGDQLRRAINRRADLGQRLILEISEPSVMQVPELVAEFMDEMQMKGVGFALDDFAAGQTSFKQFRDFYFDVLKFDGQYTKAIAQTPENRKIAAIVAALAREFDMISVASRVETPSEAEVLAALGFDGLQVSCSPPLRSPAVGGKCRKAKGKDNAA